MKRLFLGILVLGAVGTVGFLASLPRSAPPTNLKIAGTPEQLARGDYLFNAVLGCPVCHSNRDFASFGAPPVPPYGAGRACAEPGQPLPGVASDQGLPGRICFRNITPHASGIGDWTDGEILRAVREGVDRNGDALFPIMPAFIYRNLSDQDALSLVAYLRTLQPVENWLPETQINFPVNWIIRLLPQPVDAPVPHPDENNQIEHGRYLATVARCAFCHSPRDPRSRQPLSGLEFAGGAEFQGRNGLMYSTNLTPHPSGLGNVNLNQFIALFRRQDALAGAEVDLMPWTYFGNLADGDLEAMFAYFKSLEPITYQP